MEPLMERFKEKKQNVVDALREACDAIYPSTNLEAISEMCVAFLGHKTPVVRQQVALFLTRCFAMSTQTTLPKKVLKLYLPPLVKVNNIPYFYSFTSYFELLNYEYRLESQ
jgi:cytoskeleton-associated protein 5